MEARSVQIKLETNDMMICAMHPSCYAQVVASVQAMIPQVLTVNNASDLSSYFLMLSVALSITFQSAKMFTTWWCDWVDMPHSISELKTDVGQLKTDVGKLSWRTSWLAFLDK